MNILFEMAGKDMLVIGLAFVALLIFGVVVFHVVSKNNKVVPLDDDDRFDSLEEEVKPLTEEQMKAKAELERVFNQMSEDLEKKEDTTIESFEREQEENAIISYQELIRQAKAKNLIHDDEEVKTSSDNDILSNYIEPKTKENYQEQIVFDNDEASLAKEEPKKFKNSEIISPIFGIQSENGSIKNSGKHAAKNENDEFLSSLKEFRNSL